jgi:hypothetical protein
MPGDLLSHDQMCFRRKLPKTSLIKTDDVPIPAFSTITTMLSCIKRPTTSNDKYIDKSQREQLKPLNAFATVLLRDTGVVAVTTIKPLPGSVKLGIIACVDIPREEGPKTAIQYGAIGQLLTWIVTPKPGNKSDVDYPTIVEPSPPQSILLNGDLEKYIEEGP